jgi:hypothetical protein
MVIKLFEFVGQKRKAYRILIGESVGKRPFGRPGRKWLHNS